MQVTFLGAAQTVTGSCYMIEACGHRFAVDCGMHQGGKAIEERNFDTHLYDPKNIDFILLTHAHIDHSGLLPRVGAQGFKGPVYCTEPTVDLVHLMLEDSAYIQEMEYEWRLKQKKRKSGKNKLDQELLYSISQAKAVCKQLKKVPYDVSFEPVPNIKVTYRFVAHILGAAFLEIEINEDGKNTRLIFSGDLGRPGALLLEDPDKPQSTDYLFVETTYGNRNHKNEDDTLVELAEAIEYSYNLGGKVLIPTFAVERAQEIMYSLYLLKKQGKVPHDMPIFLDSPLAINATNIFHKHVDKLKIKNEAFELFSVENNPLGINFTESTEQSQALNLMEGPAIILSASGMCNAGRIKHHLKHCVWRTDTSLVFVGYQAVGTLGRNIVEGAENINLFNEQYKVAAKIFTIGGYSAHADQSQILHWMEDLMPQKPHVVLIHGEVHAQEAMAKIIKDEYQLDACIPGYLDSINLESGQSPLFTHKQDCTIHHEGIDFEPTLEKIKEHVSLLLLAKEEFHCLSQKEQVRLQSRLLKVGQKLKDITTSLQ